MYLEHRDESEAAHGFGKAIVCISEAVDASLAVHVKHSCLRWGELTGRACIKKGITWTSCAVHVHALHLMHFHCMHLSDYEDNFHACMHANFGYALSFKQIVLLLPSLHYALYTSRHSTYDLFLFLFLNSQSFTYV